MNNTFAIKKLLIISFACAFCAASAPSAFAHPEETRDVENTKINQTDLRKKVKELEIRLEQLQNRIVAIESRPVGFRHYDTVEWGGSELGVEAKKPVYKLKDKHAAAEIVVVVTCADRMSVHHEWIDRINHNNSTQRPYYKRDQNRNYRAGSMIVSYKGKTRELLMHPTNFHPNMVEDHNEVVKATVFVSEIPAAK